MHVFDTCISPVHVAQHPILRHAQLELQRLRAPWCMQRLAVLMRHTHTRSHDTFHRSAMCLETSVIFRSGCCFISSGRTWFEKIMYAVSDRLGAWIACATRAQQSSEVFHAMPQRVPSPTASTLLIVRWPHDPVTTAQDDESGVQGKRWHTTQKCAQTRE